MKKSNLKKYELDELKRLFDAITEDGLKATEKCKKIKGELINNLETNSFWKWLDYVIHNKNEILNKKEGLINYSMHDINETMSKITYFKIYQKSYRDATINIRNEMISKHNLKLIYPYLFLISHFIELTIKTTLYQNGQEESQNHDILQLFKNNKNYLISIGLNEKYYNFCILQLDIIKEYSSNNDFSMCFRFPIDKKYKNLIITNQIRDINEETIRLLAENHKPLLMIIELLTYLSESYFYSKILSDLLKTEKNIRRQIEEILENNNQKEE